MYGIFHQAEPILFYSRLSTFPTKNYSRKCCGIVCLKCRIKLLRVEKFKKHSEFNSSLIFMRETYELFSRKSMQTGRIRQSDPNVFVFDQEQARAGADHFASSVVSTRQTYSPPSCSFSRLKEVGSIRTG